MLNNGKLSRADLTGLDREAADNTRVSQTKILLLCITLTALQAVLDSVTAGTEHTATVADWGNNCHLPGSYQGALLAFLQGEPGDQASPTCLVNTIRQQTSTFILTLSFQSPLL